MATVADNREKLRELQGEIEALIAKRHRSGRFNYLVAYCLLVLTILFSGAASIAGFLDLRPTLVGVLALIPGLLTFAVSQLKLQPRSHWHYRKRARLKALLIKTRFQTPDNPSVQELTGIAAEFNAINLSMEDEWEQQLSLQPGHAGQPAA